MKRKELANLIGLALVLASFSLQAQKQGEPNWEWWCQNIDCRINYQHWGRYIITSPAFMGPNALPVPEVSTGLINNGITWEMTGMAHFSPGDNTQNLFTELKFNLAPDIVSLTFSYYPWERFVLTPDTRDERQLSGEYYDAQGTTHGDMYFGMDIQLLKNKAKWPDIAVRAMVKTATGSGYGAARYTDAPGYYFDGSFGKTFILSSTSGNTIRPYLMIGFFAWQVNDDMNRQNDAVMGGFGADVRLGNFEIHNSFGGYNGYKGNGDQPRVYRVKLTWMTRKLDYFVRYQEGLRDFEYHTIMAGVKLKWNGSLWFATHGSDLDQPAISSNTQPE